MSSPEKERDRLLAGLSLLDWRRRVAARYAEWRCATDPEQGWLAWRAGRDELMQRHPASPVPPARRAGLTGLPFAPYDPALRWEIALDPEVAPAHLDVVTGTDGVVALDRIGVLHLPGERGDLDVWWVGGYGGGVWVPVRDATAGATTYGGGRYLLDTIKGADLGGDRATLVVDLNGLYHPSCAYDAAWACPLAPPGNRLDWPIHAGEQSQPVDGKVPS